MKWLRPKIYLLIIGITWLTLVMCLLPLFAVRGVLALVSKRMGHYSLTLWMSSDHFVNSILGGYWMTTVSSTVGHMSFTSGTANAVRIFIDYWWKHFTGQPNHCRSVMEIEDQYNFNLTQLVINFVLILISIIWVGYFSLFFILPNIF